MTESLPQLFEKRMASLRPQSEQFAVEAVESLLQIAREQRASDVHLWPESQGTFLRCLLRIDGVLHEVGRIEHHPAKVVTRLKVLASLLTYRSDVPQEGRLRGEGAEAEMRVSTYPTVHGERVVIRLLAGSGPFESLEDLGFPNEIHGPLKRLLTQTAGVLVATGPAGSGKTTTLYACLREKVRVSQTPQSICTLEDPVETLIPGVSQSHVRPGTDFDYGRGLASLLRQDPEVIMVGEIRDRETATTVFQASLTGHLVLTSFHAGTAAEAVSRLGDMEIEPYILRSGLLAILSQRLLRRLCSCSTPSEADIRGASERRGCDACQYTGYAGRFVLAELLEPSDAEVGRAIMQRQTSDELEAAARQAGMTPLVEAARRAVEAGMTSTDEVLRVFGHPVAGLFR